VQNKLLFSAVNPTSRVRAMLGSFLLCMTANKNSIIVTFEYIRSRFRKFKTMRIKLIPIYFLRVKVGLPHNGLPIEEWREIFNNSLSEWILPFSLIVSALRCFNMCLVEKTCTPSHARPRLCNIHCQDTCVGIVHSISFSLARKQWWEEYQFLLESTRFFGKGHDIHTLLHVFPAHEIRENVSFSTQQKTPTKPLIIQSKPRSYRGSLYMLLYWLAFKWWWDWKDILFSETAQQGVYGNIPYKHAK